jgi:diamine N-acetyltransferase
MIDAAHQGKGYGRAAMRALIERLARMPECAEIYLSFEPNNINAESLYRSLGFEPTGKTDEIGEIIMRYEIRSEPARAGELADVS